MTEDLTEQECLEWIESADAFDRAVWSFLMAAWLNKHGSPPNSFHAGTTIMVNVAVTMRAIPGLINSTKEIRALVPPAKVRKFLRVQKRAAFFGDLQERYQRIQEKSGTDAANSWYWSEVLRSLGPLVWNALMQVAGLETLVEFCRRDRS